VMYENARDVCDRGSVGISVRSRSRSWLDALRRLMAAGVECGIDDCGQRRKMMATCMVGSVQ
jgi:hypothetical protein